MQVHNYFPHLFPSLCFQLHHDTFNNSIWCTKITSRGQETALQKWWLFRLILHSLVEQAYIVKIFYQNSHSTDDKKCYWLAVNRCTIIICILEILKQAFKPWLKSCIAWSQTCSVFIKLCIHLISTIVNMLKYHQVCETDYVKMWDRSLLKDTLMHS